MEENNVNEKVMEENGAKENIIEENKTKKTQSPKVGVIIIIILCILLAISVTVCVVFVIKSKTEEKRKNDILQLVGLYYNTNTTIEYIYDFSDYLYQEWNKYISGEKYSSIQNMYNSVKDNQENKLSLIEDFKKSATDCYMKIKKENNYYLNNKQIKEQVDNDYKGLQEYYKFIIDNEKLSYLDLSFSKNIEYETAKTTENLFLLYIMSSTKK